MRRPILPTLSLLLVFALMGGFSSQGQEEPAPLFVERVDVNVVNVEVFVTDDEGRRVTGLTADDFEILEDGEPVEITNFYAIARQDKILRSLEEDLRSPAQPVTPATLAEDQQLSLLVYIDNFNIRPANRKRVLADLEGFLEDRIRQGDNVMLASYFRTVKIVRTFTNDPLEIIDGLREVARAATYGLTEDSQRRRTLRLMAEAAGEGRPSTAYQYLRSYVESANQDLLNSTKALAQAVQAMAGLPGRRAILYVSDGLPQRPGEEVYLQWENLFGLSTQTGNRPSSVVDPILENIREDKSQVFNRITREANAHQVTFYTLDAKGLSSSSVSAELSNLRGGPAGLTAVNALRQLNLQEPLIAMAESTGGASILNTANYDDALVDLGHDFDSFYSLGYAAPSGGDGKFHKIEVRLQQPGLKLRHRTGYVDKPPSERVADRTLSSLMLEVERNPLSISVDFGEPEKQGFRKYLLPVLVRIPIRQITLLRNGDVEQGRLKIFLVVKDEKDGVSELTEIPYPVEVAADKLTAALEQDIGYMTSLKIRPGLPQVAVGVWDELSGVDSFVHKQVRIGEP